MNRSKIKGTSWETQIVAFLRDRGWPHAERRALAGNADRGDVAGVPAVVIEAKSCARIELAAWLDEVEAEKRNDRADVGLVWVKRKGRTSPGAGYVVMSGEQAVQLLQAAGYGTPTRDAA